MFFKRKRKEKSLEDRIKKLEEQVNVNEQASFVGIENKDGPYMMLPFYEWIPVNDILKELIEKLGYELKYKVKAEKRECLKKKANE